MKKLLSFLLTAAALYVIVCFAGCGSSAGSSTESELPDNPTPNFLPGLYTPMKALEQTVRVITISL